MKFTSLLTGLYLCLTIFPFLPATSLAAETRPAIRPEQFKILHVMSYHSPWRWTDDQLQGFRDGLGELSAEIRVIQLDTKHKSSPEDIEKAAMAAMALIDQWQPDLLYTSDDDAQEYVAKHYVNKALPIVFSGVNKDPAVYGFTDSKNVTGVMEQEHFRESVHLLKKLDPKVRRIAVVFDVAPMWEPVKERMQAAAAKMPGMEFGPWDTIETFEEYQRRIGEYQDQVDAVALMGVFNFRDEEGHNIPYQEVLRWTAEHSSLPDFGFWEDRIHFGTLCGVTVSGREQGLAAGRLARTILVEGKTPSQLPMMPTVKGLPVINLARAQKLGIRPSTGVLLSTRVIQQYEWEKP